MLPHPMQHLSVARRVGNHTWPWASPPAGTMATRCTLRADAQGRRGSCRGAGTRQAASTLAARLAPRHPRQACRPTLDSLHACVPRRPKAEPSEAAALAQPRLIARPPQQLRSPTRRSECSRPISGSKARHALPRNGRLSAFLQRLPPESAASQAHRGRAKSQCHTAPWLQASRNAVYDGGDC